MVGLATWQIFSHNHVWVILLMIGERVKIYRWHIKWERSNVVLKDEMSEELLFHYKSIVERLIPKPLI